MTQTIQDNPFRKPEERLEFFQKLVQMNPTKKWLKTVASQSPAANPAGVVNPKLVEQTVQEQEEDDKKTRAKKENK